MTLLRIIALTLPMAMMSAAALADGGSTTSEFEHQADAGKWEVSPSFTFGSIKSNYSTTCAACGTTTSGTDSQFNFNAKGEYGINEMLSVGLNLGYSTDSWSYSPGGGNSMKVQGMPDPSVFLNGRNDLGVGSIHWGAILTFALAKGQLNNTTANETDGGFTFTPFVGYEAMVGPGTLGARVSYDVLKTNDNFNDNVGGTSTSAYDKNGNILTFAVFWEMNFNPVVWGIDVGLLNHSASSTVESGVTTNNSDNFTAFNISTYANWTVAQDISILPTIGYGTNYQAITANVVPGSTSSAGIYGTIGARFAF